MPLSDMSDEWIESRLNVLEKWIADERDTKSLAVLNSMFQKLIDEQVRRDLQLGGSDETDETVREVPADDAI